MIAWRSVLAGRRVLVGACVLALAVASMSCGPARALAAGDPHQGARPALVLAVNPYLSAEELYSRFRPLADELERALGRQVEVRVGRDYAEHIRAVGEDRVDLAYVGPASRAHLIRSYGPRPLLVRQEVSGQHMQQSVIAVRRDSPLSGPGELKGRRMAYSDRDSATGYLLASELLRRSGVPEDALGRTRFLNTQTNVALAVLAGDADAGALRLETYEQFAERGLRVLATLPAVPDFGFIVSRRLPAADVETIRQTLLHLKDSAHGRAAMARIHPGLMAFSAPDPADEIAMRPLIRAFASAGAAR